MPEVLRSLADPGFLADLVRREWGVDTDDVVLHRTLVNDVYRVGADHFLKVYRHGWRSPDDVAWECDLIAHLKAHDVPVVTVAPRTDGTKVGIWRAPEGPRPLVLMERIAGHRPTAPFAPETHREHGRIIARLHTAADTFSSPHRRRPHDLTSMLDEPLDAILPHLTVEDRRRAIGLAAAARDALSKRPPTWGLCHGDATMDNILVRDDGAGIVIFDFDLAGPGHLAADFPFGIDNWDHFLAGYRDIRSVHPDDLAAAPWLGVAKVLENLRFHVVVKPGWRGTESIAEGWLDVAVAALRNLATAREPDEASPLRASAWRPLATEVDWQPGPGRSAAARRWFPRTGGELFRPPHRVILFGGGV